MSRRRLIVHADDLGLTEGHNRAIFDAHHRGILTSASVLACGSAFDDAAERARAAPALSIGVHLTLLEGRPVLPPDQVPSLVDEKDRFGQSCVRLFWRLATRRTRLDQVHAEWRAQIVRVMATGLPVTHLDSHKHIHMHPQLLEVALALADEFGLRRMRLSRPLRLASGPKPAILGTLALWAQRRAAQRGVRSPVALLGLEASGQMTAARVLALLSRPWQGTCELMMHPAYRCPALEQLRQAGYRWIARYQFERERMALYDADVRATLVERGIELVSYESV